MGPWVLKWEKGPAASGGSHLPDAVQGMLVAHGTGTAPTWRQVVSREKDGPGVLWIAWE